MIATIIFWAYAAAFVTLVYRNERKEQARERS